MFHSITLSLSLLLHVHQIGGGFLRFNDPEHMTAPLDLDDLDPGSYDELMKYNPSLGAPHEVIRYGGDPNKPFDWSAPEIEDQDITLVTETNDFMYKDETEGIAEGNRDEIDIFSKVHRSETAKISKEIRDDTDIVAEKRSVETVITTEKKKDEIDIATEKYKNETVEKIAEKNRNETDIIAEKMIEKNKEKPSSLKYTTLWPVLFDNKTSVYVTENQTEAQKDFGWMRNFWTLDQNITRPTRINRFNKKILRQKNRPKKRYHRIEVDERTRHDRHVPFWWWRRTHDYDLEGTYTTSCYRCGELKYGKWWRPSVEARERKGKIIPTSVLCYEAFEGGDWRYKTQARHLRTRCYNNKRQQYIYAIGQDNYFYYHECIKPRIYPFLIDRTYNKGNPMECFGRYTGKCFKRYMDVGKVYTERGCTSWPPHESNTFASHRFTKLEILLHKVDNGCVASPVASLTPFARGVSLYVRYHVCVCTGKLCNAATHSNVSLLLLFSALSILSLVYGT